MRKSNAQAAATPTEDDNEQAAPDGHGQDIPEIGGEEAAPQAAADKSPPDGAGTGQPAGEADRAPGATAPRLDNLGAPGDASGRRPFELDDDEGEDPSFGPTLGAWLAAYRARQAANQQAAEPPRQVSMAPRPPMPSRPAGARMAPPIGRQWAGRAQVALNDMLSSMPPTPPPEWLAAGSRPSSRRPAAGRWLIGASVALLMAGTAATAFLLAARDAGVDASFGQLAATFDPASESGTAAGPAEETVEASAPATATGEVPAQGGPEIAIVPTRIVTASMATPEETAGAPPEPAAPARNRSTILLPEMTETGGVETLDHPRAGEQRPSVAAAAPAVPETMARSATDAPPQTPMPANDEPVRVASLEQASEVRGVLQPGADKSASGVWSGTDPQFMLRRAEMLLLRGDVLGARLLFEEAARAGNAEAALGAGLTYDPMLYQRIGARGIEPDVTMALSWYNEALGGGEKAAAEEIGRLEAYLNK